ncbi:unnamed protein product [Linum tenue]|uniref:OTU domain-containing protein n=1 Tax=Linum tenue TaxID=586396 RepID=A0AAV0PBN6_9ROSI|nr:unnamed protein product [Linum tenue]
MDQTRLLCSLCYLYELFLLRVRFFLRGTVTARGSWRRFPSHKLQRRRHSSPPSSSAAISYLHSLSRVFRFSLLTSFGLSSTLFGQMAGTGEKSDKLCEAAPVGAIEKKQESRDELLARHRKETVELQNKETELKKGAAKGSKAEQKAKKKAVEEEISLLSAKLKEKQAQELASLGYVNNTNDINGKSKLDNIVMAIAGVSVTDHSENNTRRSKSGKRKDKRAQQEVEREKRIQEEQSNLVSDRMIEDEKLGRKLEPLGLTVNEIKPDGNCLYRAVEDQLALMSGGSSPYNHQDLRKMVADYMRQNSSEFLPFFLSENDAAAGDDSDSSLADRFESYCEEVESTAAWGGQLELGALTHCLKKPIMIYSGSFPDVEMGQEYKSGGGNALSNGKLLMLSYHKHAFGLGEHYNSVVPNLIR